MGYQKGCVICFNNGFEELRNIFIFSWNCFVYSSYKRQNDLGKAKQSVIRTVNVANFARCLPNSILCLFLGIREVFISVPSLQLDLATWLDVSRNTACYFGHCSTTPPACLSLCCFSCQLDGEGWWKDETEKILVPIWDQGRDLSSSPKHHPRKLLYEERTYF